MKARLFIPLVRVLFLLTGLSTGHAVVSIVNQPQSSAVVVGNVAVFTVLATGNGTMTYQWMKNGTAISGATSSFLELNPVAFTDATGYTVAVTDADPSTVTSSVAGLLVNSAKGGDVDFSFNAGSSLDSGIKAMAVQSDGKVLIGGQFTSITGMARGAIARLNSDGSSDYSFGYGLAGANNVVNAVAVQSDGKVLIGGQFTSVNGTACGAIARLNSDGTLDTSFGNGQPGIGGMVYSLAVQSNGQVLVGGQFNSVNGVGMNGIVRLNSDGTLDTTFGTGQFEPFSVNAVAVQSDGRVLVGGQFFGAANGIARLNSNGSLDTTFNTGQFQPPQVGAVAVQSDGKVLIGGQFFGTRSGIARLNTDGTLDTTFGNGQAGANQVSCVAVQSNGQVLIAGPFSTVNGTACGSIARLNTDGTLDTTFGSGLAGVGAGSQVNAMVLQSNGQVLIGGFLSTVNGIACLNMARLNANGTTDGTFSNNGLTVGAGGVAVLAMPGGGKLLVCGWVSSGNGTASQGITRLNSNGTVDPTFGNGLVEVNNDVGPVVLQSDGKLLVGGSFTSIGGATRHGIARLNSDGSIDNTFGNGLAGINNSYEDSYVSSIVVQSDGRVIIGGYFSTVNGTARVGIARLNTDGSLDTTFGNGQAGVDGYNSISSMALQSNGQVLIGGDFASINGTARGGIARLNSDGTVDTTFGNGLAGANYGVGPLALQSDGQVLIGGYFTSVNGTACNCLARLNSDGTLDTTFGSGQSGPESLVGSIALQSDGRLLITGDFNSVNGTPRGYVARLNSDGTLDSTFGNGLAGANNSVGNAAIQSDGKVVIGGSFSTVNGTARRYLARLHYSTVDADLAALTLSAGSLSPGFNPGSITYTASVTTSSLSVAPTTDDPAATVRVSVNGGSYATVASGHSSSALPLSLGSNTVNVQVTSADTTVVKTYAITVTVSTPSSDATLAGLTLSNGAPTPVFAPAVLAYNATEPNALSSITVAPIGNQANATITVNGTPIVSSQASTPISLNVGNNSIAVVVTAQDGATVKSYTISVLRMTAAMDTWTQTYFGNSTANTGPTASFAGDGIANLEKFAFGTNPTVAGSPPLQYVGTLAGGGTIAANGTPTTGFQNTDNGLEICALFVRRDDYATAGVIYTPYFSGDLNSWQVSTITPTVLADNGSYQVVSVPYPSSINGQNASYFRVRLSTGP